MRFIDTNPLRKYLCLLQIDEDLKNKSEELLNQSVDLDKPGFAQFYCLHCAKYFTDDHSLQQHFRTKVHKRRLKALELEPYSIEESERAAGHGNFKTAEKRIIETQPTKEEFAKGKRVKVEKVVPEDGKDMQIDQQQWRLGDFMCFSYVKRDSK